MKRVVATFTVYLVLCLSLNGCGGGGSSSSATEDLPNTSSATPPSSPSGLPNSIDINPLIDLGMVAGDNVCFRLKSYNNFTESDFSKAICSQIKNESALTLSWNQVSGNIIGYYIYFGPDKNSATNFLKDVFES